MAYHVSLLGVCEPRVGRPQKVLHILEENFIEWWQVKDEEGSTDDNAVA